MTLRRAFEAEWDTPNPSLTVIKAKARRLLFQLDDEASQAIDAIKINKPDFALKFLRMIREDIEEHMP